MSNLSRRARARQRASSNAALAPIPNPLLPAVAPVQTPVLDTSKPGIVELRTASVSVVTPYAVWSGRLTNPDTVIRYHGTQYGVAFYATILQQNLGLSSSCSQWEDRINAIDRTFTAGDDSEMADQMLKDIERDFARIPGKNIINLWILRARWYGITSIGKAGWRKSAETGNLAPFDLYNIDPWRWKFGPNFEPYLLTQGSPFMGIPVEDRSVFFSRWGSLFTGYGQSDLQDIYLSAWFCQNVTEMLIQSLEILGRPIPWIEVPYTLQGKEFDDYEAGIKLQYKYYVITRTAAATTRVTFPNLTVLANGSAGKSELDFIRYHAGLMDRRILGTMQTQDRTGGSRALEDTRMEIAQDKTPPGSQHLDEVWNGGYVEDYCLVNFGNQPRQTWPRMNSNAGDQGREKLTGPMIIALRAVGDDLRMNLITEDWAIEMLVMSGFSRTRAEDIVESMTDPESGLSKEPMIPPPAPVIPSGEGAQQ